MLRGTKVPLSISHYIKEKGQGLTVANEMEREVMYGEIDGEVVEIIPDDPKIYEEIAKEEAEKVKKQA